MNIKMLQSIRISLLMIFLFSSLMVICQDTVLNKYGLWVIHDLALYKKTVTSDPGKEMLSLSQYIPGVILELKYSGKDNFMHQPLYPALHTTYLRRTAINALVAVETDLEKMNLSIKIWDAYRPYSVTEKMWEPVKDDRYAADPKFGSGHNRGIAVDLTLINKLTGSEIEMGTAFDNFSDTAHHDFKGLPDPVLQNRLLLRTVMEKHGFKALETEYWHYYLPETGKYELLDIPFSELDKL